MWNTPLSVCCSDVCAQTAGRQRATRPAGAQTATLQPASPTPAPPVPINFSPICRSPVEHVTRPDLLRSPCWAHVKRRKASISAADSRRRQKPEVKREGAPKLAPRGAESFGNYPVILFDLLFNIYGSLRMSHERKVTSRSKEWLKEES